MKKIFIITGTLLIITTQAHAWIWKDLWATRDQQASIFMQKKQFKKAENTFKNLAWQAAAAFRAQDYEQASQSFAKLQTADGYYNQGNALAYLEKYHEALKAYDNSLKIRPKDPDTLHNKKIIEALLKKEQQSQEPKSQEQKSQEQKAQEQKTQEQKAQEQKTQEQKAQEQKAQEQKAQEQKAQEQKSQEQKAQEQKAQEQKAQEQKTQEQKSQEQKAQEQKKQKANEQWLHIIPDDPGGLLKQKFMRDHLRRIEGEDS